MNKMGQLRQIARETSLLHWPLGALVILGEGIRLLVRIPATPHKYSKVGVPTEIALSAVMKWIGAAQDANRDGGISAYFSLYGGFGPSYPETTGYLIPTLINYSLITGDRTFSERALRAGAWLKTLQLDSGAFREGFARNSDGPSVFNTGQIIFGLLSVWEHTEDDEYLQSAIRAGKWLTSVQSDDGAWRQCTYEGQSHVYYTMVAWSLAELFKVTEKAEFREATDRNIKWALAQVKPNGWFEGHNLNNRPNYLHFIAYTLQGLLESAVILECSKGIEKVRVASERLMRKFEITKSLAGAYTLEWKPDAKYMCLTGNAQMAVVWQRLGELTEDLRFSNAALKMNELLKSKISYKAPRGIKGAIKGSDPIWGRYLSLRYPNWAAKFTADSFLLELRFLERLQRHLPL